MQNGGRLDLALDRAARLAGLRTVTPDGYDELPYASMPYPQTQPSRLAAVAALYGVDPPPVERARVLELGCASGGNLIPLAARFPDARFLGVDLGRRHVDDASGAIQALGLANIEVRHADIAELKPEGAFDYVICHGVFSWTPPHVQDAILRLCAASMAQNAVALVSFNVLPGWHLRSAVRDLCLRRVDPALPPLQRVAAVRGVLNDIAAMSSGGDAYGTLIRSEAKRLARRPASYIAGEFLAAYNAPCHFREFLAHAQRHGLDYMAEADLDASVPSTVHARQGAVIDARAGGDRAEREQWIDDFTGRTFRHALLVRAGVARSVAAPSGLKSAHVSTRWRPAPEQSTEQGAAFQDPNNRILRVADATLARVVTALSRLSPHTIAMADLAKLVGISEDALCELALRPVRLGHIELSSVAFNPSAAPRERAKVWDVARREAEAGQPWLTNRRHEPVRATPIVAFVARLLDGTRDDFAVRAAVSAALRGGLIATRDQFDDNSVDAVAARYVEQAQAYFAREALLV